MAGVTLPQYHAARPGLKAASRANPGIEAWSRGRAGAIPCPYNQIRMGHEDIFTYRGIPVQDIGRVVQYDICSIPPTLWNIYNPPSIPHRCAHPLHSAALPSQMPSPSPSSLTNPSLPLLTDDHYYSHYHSSIRLQQHYRQRLHHHSCNSPALAPPTPPSLS